MDFTQNIASKIIKNSTSAIGASIKCINSNFKDGENGYLTEIQEFSNCFETEDFIEGTNAFLNKQKPRFK
jgi:enoyl-CoA hydratase